MWLTCDTYHDGVRMPVKPPEHQADPGNAPLPILSAPPLPIKARGCALPTLSEGLT